MFANGEHKNDTNTETIAKILALDYVIAKKYLKEHTREFESFD